MILANNFKNSNLNYIITYLEGKDLNQFLMRGYKDIVKHNYINGYILYDKDSLVIKQITDEIIETILNAKCLHAYF